MLVCGTTPYRLSQRMIQFSHSRDVRTAVVTNSNVDVGNGGNGKSSVTNIPLCNPLS